MSESKLTTATKRRDDAEEKLNALLEAGEDATQARETLGAAERELKKATDAEKERQAKLDAEQRAQADAFAAELAAELTAKMAEIVGSIEPPEPPSIDTAHAQTVLKARQEHAEAREALTQAQARLETLEARHSELSQQWDAIASRRAQGDTQADDPQTLACLAADRDGIERLIEAMQGEVQRADLEFARAAETLKLAERRWMGVTSSSWQKAMQATAAVLEARIARAADEIRAHPGWNREHARRYEPVNKDLKNHLHEVGWSPYPRHRFAA